MRRILLVLTVSLVMVAMLMSSALPAVAQGPPTFSLKAFETVKNAEEKNPAIEIKGNNVCLDTPGPGTTGHLSGFPDDSPCKPKA